MRVARTIAEVREALTPDHRSARAVGLVPTMGYLHDGHLSLIDRCRSLADRTVLSIYVNPLQFAPSEDYERYPRDLPRDLQLAESHGVDLVFVPADRELYPRPPTTVVTPRRLADRLCGLSRPGHFEGVLTVVAKLFGIVRPDLAVFGQKDFQQSVLIRRMVADLDMAVRIEVAPIVRDADGLALSSRNAYLGAADRRRALALSRGLARAVSEFRSGARDARTLLGRVRQRLEGPEGVDRVEYVEVVEPHELERAESAGPESVVVVAAHVGPTRLIDNAILGRPDPALDARLHIWSQD